MRDLSCRIHGLKCSVLDAMAALTNESSTHEYLAVKRRWQHFKARATEEATEPGEAREVIESCWSDPAFLNYRKQCQRRWPKSPAGKRYKREYMRTYMRDRRAKQKLEQLAGDNHDQD